MHEAEMLALLEQAMSLSGKAVWVEVKDPRIADEGYRMFTGSVVDFPGSGEIHHRYVIAAKPDIRGTARGTYTNVKDKTILNIPPVSAWTLFKEAIECLKKG